MQHAVVTHAEIVRGSITDRLNQTKFAMSTSRHSSVGNSHRNIAEKDGIDRTEVSKSSSIQPPPRKKGGKITTAQHSTYKIQAENISRTTAFLDGKLMSYKVESFVDSKSSKAARVGSFGISLLKYYHPLYATLESMLPYSKYGLAAVIFRRDLGNMMSTMLQLIASVRRDAGVDISATKTMISLYYYAAYVPVVMSFYVANIFSKCTLRGGIILHRSSTLLYYMRVYDP